MENLDQMRDNHIKSQLESFIDYFKEIDLEKILAYQEQSMMDDDGFVKYLEGIRNNLSFSNPTYGCLVPIYQEKIDNIVKLFQINVRLTDGMSE